MNRDRDLGSFHFWRYLLICGSKIAISPTSLSCQKAYLRMRKTEDSETLETRDGGARPMPYKKQGYSHCNPLRILPFPPLKLRHPPPRKLL